METITAEQYNAGEVTDMNIKRMSERELKEELGGHKSSEEIIDAFEEERGIKVKKEKKTNIRNDVRIFDIRNDADLKLYQGLINSPRYTIMLFKDHFSSVTGKYTIVCHYQEDLDSTFPAITTADEDSTT